ncbi:DUF4386 domain-containing protein [Agromyces bauzanensis]
MNRQPSDPEYAQLYRVAGVASLLYVLLSVAALAIDFAAPPPATGGVETLEFIAGHKVTYIAEQILWIAPDILPVLTFLALYLALRHVDRGLALVSAAVGGIPWAVLLAIPVSSRGSLVLVTLSDWYMAAATPELRDRYATAAEAIIAEGNTPAIAGVLAAVGILLVSLVMLRSTLPRTLAWLGIATGVVGVASEVLRYAAPMFYSVYGLLLWAWFVMVGIVLLRLASSHRGHAASTNPAAGATPGHRSGSPSTIDPP